MPHVIKLKGGKIVTLFGIEDILDEIDSAMGYDVRRYIEDWKAGVDKECEDNQYDWEEVMKELDEVKDHQHSFICDLKDEVENLEDLLSADRINRKKIQSVVRNISKMLYREL